MTRSDPTWTAQPAIIASLVKLAELYGRALRVEIVRREQGSARIASLLARRPL